MVHKIKNKPNTVGNWWMENDAKKINLNFLFLFYSILLMLLLHIDATLIELLRKSFTVSIKSKHIHRRVGYSHIQFACTLFAWHYFFLSSTDSVITTFCWLQNRIYFLTSTMQYHKISKSKQILLKKKDIKHTFNPRKNRHKNRKKKCNVDIAAPQFQLNLPFKNYFTWFCCIWWKISTSKC